ncbi:hypothetical protein N2152v2_003651 [Parachlorella kessleri]
MTVKPFDGLQSQGDAGDPAELGGLGSQPLSVVSGFSAEDKDHDDLEGDSPLAKEDHPPELKGLEREETEVVRVLSTLRSPSHDRIKLPPKPHNPLKAFLWWYLSWAVPGMGMFSEAYMIFAIGNIKPFLSIDYPHCIGEVEPVTCKPNTVDSIEYVEICGVIFGMLSLGFLGDIIGRKWGSRLTMTIMFIGGVLLTSASSTNDSAFLAFFLFALAFYGVGVGGEYPMASSSAAERAEGSKEMRKKRGETVVLTFSQQGWGNFANTLVIIILLAMQGATGLVSQHQAEVTWRVQFAVGTFICLVVMIYRWFYLEESEVWKAEKADMDHKREDEEGGAKGLINEDYKRRFREYWIIVRFYWPRLFITCIGWVANDFAFYGNKLSQSKFISVISGPDATQYTKMQWTLLNSGVALVGYYFAAFTIDRSWWGRRRMQFLYFFSSFWNQFGPNCTTWLVAGEVYPTDVRAFFHGISAAFGKAGAAIAAAIFENVSTRDTYYASAAAGIVGFVITVIFLPDTTGLDLGEIDRMNRYMVEGQYDKYYGEAINPKYLSLYERWRGYGRHYDRERDEEQKRLQGIE